MAGMAVRSENGANHVGKARAAVFVAAAVGLGIAHLGTSTMPFQIGALMDGAGFSASKAGIFGFFEVASLSLTMLLISSVIDRFGAAAVAMLGVLICSVAHCLMFFVHPAILLMCALATGAGIGYGLVFSAVIAAVARWRNADKIYAFGNAGALFLIVGLMSIFPLLSRQFGTFGPFLGVAAVMVVASPALLFFGNAGSAAPVAGKVSFGQGGVPALLAIWGATSLGNGAVWGFAERIGHELGIPAETLALILSASTFSGVAGTAIAGTLALRISRISGLLIGLVGTGMSGLMLALAPNSVVFAIAVLANWVFFMMSYSMLLTIAADIDPSGRVGTAGGGCERMGFALGVPVAGFLIDYISLPAIGVLGLVSCIGLLPFALPSLSRALKGAPVRT